MRQQRHVASVVPAEVVDEQVRRREDRSEEPDDERDHEQRDDDDHDEDRQRRAHQEPDEHDGRDLDGAQRTGGGDACHFNVLFEMHEASYSLVCSESSASIRPAPQSMGDRGSSASGPDGAVGARVRFHRAERIECQWICSATHPDHLTRSLSADSWGAPVWRFAQSSA